MVVLKTSSLSISDLGFCLIFRNEIFKFFLSKPQWKFFPHAHLKKKNKKKKSNLCNITFFSICGFVTNLKTTEFCLLKKYLFSLHLSFIEDVYVCFKNLCNIKSFFMHTVRSVRVRVLSFKTSVSPKKLKAFQTCATCIVFLHSV